MIKTNIKMRVTPEQSAKVQEICFKNGINWGFPDDTIMYEDEPYIFIGKENCLSWLGENQNDSFMKAEEDEIDPELFIRTNGSCVEKEEAKMKDELKERGIKIGNKVKLRNGTVDTITYIDFNNREDFPIVLLSGRTYTIKGKHLNHTSFVSVYDVVDWNYKEPEDIVENPNLVTDINNNKAKNPNSKHYELWENFEAIDVIKLALTDEEYKGFLKGNILKYRLRVGKKDDVSKEIEKIKDYERELNK